LNEADLLVVHLDLEAGWRGGERQVAWLVEGLSERGLRQIAVARRRQPLALRLATIPGVEVSPVSGRVAAWLALPAPRRGVIYHAHTGGTIPLAVLRARRGAVSLVTRRLDLPPRRWPICAADHVVAISSAVATVLQASGLPADRISVIPSAIDLGRRNEPGDRARLRASLAIPGDAVVGLTIAALSDQKDPLTLVRALVHTPTSYVHLWVGDGPLRHAVENAAKKLGVASRLHCLGFDPDPDRWFAAADLFVLPSVHEGLGTVLLDAFLFGVPVVSTAIRGTSDILRNNETALLCPVRDPRALAGCIAEVCNRPDRGADLARRGRQLLPQYDKNAMVAAYWDLYGKLTERSV
jgi:glycosyltransferase involved in cell wall biosynthesis